MKVVGSGSAKPPLEVTSEGSFAIAPFNGARHAYSTLPLGDRIDTREPFFSSLLELTPRTTVRSSRYSSAHQVR